MEIKSKAENYKLYELGIFGNKVRTWNDLEDIYESGYSGNVTIRYKQPGSPFCKYDVPRSNIEPTINEWVTLGANPDKVTFNESCPNELLLIQGEMMRDVDGWYLFYSMEKNLPMREALKDGKSARGLAAIDVIKRTSTLASYEDFRLLFELFPNSIVEFGTYSQNLGVLPRRNTIIWEVRNY